MRTALMLLALSGVSFFSLTPVSFSDESVRVTASVGAVSTPSRVTSVIPSNNPVSIAKSSVQTFSVKLNDPDSSVISYTVTPSAGVVMGTSGNLNVSGGNATLNFTYFAPSYKAGFSSIVVTLNDLSGSLPVVHRIDLYVY